MPDCRCKCTGAGRYGDNKKNRFDLNRESPIANRQKVEFCYSGKVDASFKVFPATPIHVSLTAAVIGPTRFTINIF